MSIYTPRAATRPEADRLKAHGFFGWDNARDGRHAKGFYERLVKALDERDEALVACGRYTEVIATLERERDEARQACEKAIRERQSAEVREDDWHRSWERAEAELHRLRKAVRHVVADSPGTPDSVKRYLRGAALAEEDA